MNIFSFWRKHFLVAELILGIAATCLFFLWMEKYDGNSVVSEVLHERRGSIYGALASVVGALLGFAIAAATIAMTLAGGEQMRIVRQSPHYRQVGQVFISATRWLGLATIASITGLILDRDQQDAHSLLSAFTATPTSQPHNIIWVQLFLGNG